jgi:hypothetical protein
MHRMAESTAETRDTNRWLSSFSCRHLQAKASSFLRRWPGETVPRSSYSAFGWMTFMPKDFYLEQGASKYVGNSLATHIGTVSTGKYLSSPAISQLPNCSIRRYLASLAAYHRRTKERSPHFPSLWNRRSHVLTGCSGMPSCCVAVERLGCIAASQPYSLCPPIHGKAEVVYISRPWKLRDRHKYHPTYM